MWLYLLRMFRYVNWKTITFFWLFSVCKMKHNTQKGKRVRCYARMMSAWERLAHLSLMNSAISFCICFPFSCFCSSTSNPDTVAPWGSLLSACRGQSDVTHTVSCMLPLHQHQTVNNTWARSYVCESGHMCAWVTAWVSMNQSVWEGVYTLAGVTLSVRFSEGCV